MKTALTLTALLIAGAGSAASPAYAQSGFQAYHPAGTFQPYTGYKPPAPAASIYAPPPAYQAPRAPKFPAAGEPEMFKPYRGTSTYDSLSPSLEPNGKPAKRRRGYSTYP